MSVLRRQPGGFEGLAVALVGAEVDALALADLDEVGALVLNGRRLTFTHDGVSAQEYDAIINRPDVHLVEADVLPRLEGICDRASYAFVTSIASSLQKVPRPQHFGIRVEAVDPRFHIPRLERPNRLPHNLHVLLGHLPRSIPQVQESA